jgi:hypothetical protein
MVVAGFISVVAFAESALPSNQLAPDKVERKESSQVHVSHANALAKMFVGHLRNLAETCKFIPSILESISFLVLSSISSVKRGTFHILKFDVKQ